MDEKKRKYPDNDRKFFELACSDAVNDHFYAKILKKCEVSAETERAFERAASELAAIVAAGVDLDAFRELSPDSEYDRCVSLLPLAAELGLGDAAEELLRAGVPIECRDANMDGYTPLMVASHYANMEMMDLLLAKGAAPDGTNPGKRTPLMAAITSRRSDLAAAEKLIRAGADINARDAVGSTALISAARSGRYEAASFLLARGADPCVRDENFATALTYAMYAKTIDCPLLSQLRVAGAVSSPDYDLLHYCTAYRPDAESAAMIGKLLGEGAHIDFRDDWTGLSPILIVSSQQWKKESARAIIGAGANLAVTDLMGRCPVRRAKDAGARDIHEMLIAAGAPENFDRELIDAARDNDRRLIADLVGRGADPMARDEAGNTPLIIAARRGNLEAVRSLVEAGADTNARNAAGRTALIEAAAAFCPTGDVLEIFMRIAGELIDAGADMSYADRTGMTAIEYSSTAASMRRFLEKKNSAPARFLRNIKNRLRRLFHPGR